MHQLLRGRFRLCIGQRWRVHTLRSWITAQSWPHQVRSVHVSDRHVLVQLRRVTVCSLCGGEGAQSEANGLRRVYRDAFSRWQAVPLVFIGFSTIAQCHDMCGMREWKVLS